MKQIHIRIEDESYASLVERAKKEQRSVAAMTRILLLSALLEVTMRDAVDQGVPHHPARVGHGDGRVEPKRPARPITKAETAGRK